MANIGHVTVEEIVEGRRNDRVYISGAVIHDLHCITLKRDHF